MSGAPSRSLQQAPSFFGLVATARARLDILDRQYKRDKDGRFGSGGGMHPAIAACSTTSEVEAVLSTELYDVTGRHVTVHLTGLGVEVARVHAEGVLRAMKQFPDTDLQTISTFGPGGQHSSDVVAGTDHSGSYAVTTHRPGTRGSDIYFNTRYGDIDTLTDMVRQNDAVGWLSGQSGDLSRMASHEVGHAWGNTLKPGAARQAVGELAIDRGLVDAVVVREVSGYARKDLGELIAESFSDVVSRGDGASQLSKDVVDTVGSQFEAGLQYPNNQSRFFHLLAAARNRTYKRDADGRFGSGDGGPRGIRDTFAQAKTITSLELAAEGELGSILGQRVAVKLAGLEMDAARAHVEGIARSAELYPGTDLISVTSYGPRGQVSDIPGQQPGVHDKVWGVTSSVAGRPGADIYLNTRIDAPKMRRVTTKAVAEGVVDGDMSDITWTGSHEMGHAAASMMRRGDPQQGAVRIATETAGGSVEHVYNELRTTVSRYALTPGGDELIGEATAQVASLGSAASPISKAVVKGMQDNWDEWSI